MESLTITFDTQNRKRTLDNPLSYLACSETELRLNIFWRAKIQFFKEVEKFSPTMVGRRKKFPLKRL